MVLSSLTVLAGAIVQWILSPLAIEYYKIQKFNNLH